MRFYSVCMPRVSQAEINVPLELYLAYLRPAVKLSVLAKGEIQPVSIDELQLKTAMLFLWHQIRRSSCVEHLLAGLAPSFSTMVQN